MLRVDCVVGRFAAKVIRCLSSVALLRWLLDALPPTSRAYSSDPWWGSGCERPVYNSLRMVWWGACAVGRHVRRALIVLWLVSCCLVMLILTTLSTLVCPPAARSGEYEQLESDEHMERLRESSGISRLPFDFIRNALPPSPNARWLTMCVVACGAYRSLHFQRALVLTLLNASCHFPFRPLPQVQAQAAGARAARWPVAYR